MSKCPNIETMLQLPDEKHDFLESLARIASLYYLEGKTQAEVARVLGISRQKVQRSLRQARELGIVDINIRPPSAVSLDLEEAIRIHFGLKDVIVAPSHAHEVERRQSVARAAAEYLERHLFDGMGVTVGMGRNTGEIPNYYSPPRAIKCAFISAMGNSPYVGESINPNDICQKLAANSRGEAVLLHVPAYVESRQVRDMLLEQEAVGPILNRARKAHMAVVGIGTPEQHATLVRMDCLSSAEAKGLASMGAVGDVLGSYFNVSGEAVSPSMRRCLVGLTLDDLRRIATVMAVVSEKGKAKAILGALRTGVIHTLVMESENATELSRMIH